MLLWWKRRTLPWTPLLLFLPCLYFTIIKYIPIEVMWFNLVGSSAPNSHLLTHPSPRGNGRESEKKIKIKKNKPKEFMDWEKNKSLLRQKRKRINSNYNNISMYVYIQMMHKTITHQLLTNVQSDPKQRPPPPWPTLPPLLLFFSHAVIWRGVSLWPV